MTDPQVGDIVDITIKGARVKREGGPGFTIFDIDGYGHNLTLMTAHSAVSVDIVEPATPGEWPPQAGDLWRDRDQELWFGTTSHVYRHGPDDFPAEPVVELVHAGGGPGRVPEGVNRECGPLQLVRREAEQPASSWPPRPGDVWRDHDGDEWVAVDTHQGVWMRPQGRVSQGGGMHNPDYVQDRHGPLTFVTNVITASRNASRRHEQPGAGE